MAYTDALTGLPNRARFTLLLDEALDPSPPARTLADGAVRRPRRLQDGQRQPRPHGRRRAARRGRATAGIGRAPSRHRVAVRRRRVRRPARDSRRRRGRASPTACSTLFDDCSTSAGREVRTRASIGIAVGGATPRPSRSCFATPTRRCIRQRTRQEPFAVLRSPRCTSGRRSARSSPRRLGRGIERGEIEVHYQPIIDLDSAACTASKRSSAGGTRTWACSPGSFISLAEERGHSTEITVSSSKTRANGRRHGVRPSVR